MKLDLLENIQINANIFSTNFECIARCTLCICEPMTGKIKREKIIKIDIEREK